MKHLFNPISIYYIQLHNLVFLWGKELEHVMITLHHGHMMVYTSCRTWLRWMAKVRIHESCIWSCRSLTSKWIHSAFVHFTTHWWKIGNIFDKVANMLLEWIVVLVFEWSWLKVKRPKRGRALVFSMPCYLDHFPSSMLTHSFERGKHNDLYCILLGIFFTYSITRENVCMHPLPSCTYEIKYVTMLLPRIKHITFSGLWIEVCGPSNVWINCIQRWFW